MDVRKITVVSTATQKKSVVETDATTLAELKSALRAANIDYSGMTFYEGLTHTELLTDEAILPHDVPYKGATTNELVFMLTNPNKKIKSGALSEVRETLYRTIKSRNLEDAIMEKFGKHYTNCKTSELAEFVEHMAVEDCEVEGCVDLEAREAIIELLDSLNDEEDISSSKVKEIKSLIIEDVVDEVPYSDNEIDNMFNFMN